MKVNLDELNSRVKERIIKKRTYNGQTLWCYTQHCVFDNLWDDYSRFARGIVTLPDGTVIARPFPKFYNLGDPAGGEIPWHEPIEVTEKLDGSLIILSYHSNKPLITTKSSFENEYTDFAYNWIMENIPDWLTNPEPHNNTTYCFEAIMPEINPDNRKAIDYGDRKDLNLLAKINTISGEEVSYDSLLSIGKAHGIPVTPKHEYDDIHDLVKKIKSRAIDEGEGVVLRFTESNKRVKVKGDEFMRTMRLLSHIGDKVHEKHILDSLSRGDDVESLYDGLPDEFYGEIHTKMESLKKEYDFIYSRASDALPEIRNISSRKAQSQYIRDNPYLFEIQGILFSMLDGFYNPTMIWNHIKKAKKAERREERK